MTAVIVLVCQESSSDDEVPVEINWNVPSQPHLSIWTTRHYLAWNNKNSNASLCWDQQPHNFEQQLFAVGAKKKLEEALCKELFNIG